MGSRREEERNEKIIRGLMKLPPNRRCINCNSLGPQYVCTNFWTFVCTTCSGIHREFTHRVKSVSMAKFTPQEVEALQNGGNQRAREMYLKDWDSQRQRLPDSSNVDKVREFIKSVYVDQRYAGGKNSDKPPRDMQSMRNREEETRRASSYHSYSQSPPYDYQYEERRYGRQGATLTRKPGSDRGLYEGKISSLIYSPGRLSERANEDRFANEGSAPRVSDYSASSGGDPFRSGAQSPNFQKDSEFGSPQRHLSRDFSGNNMSLQTSNTSREAYIRRDTNGIPHPQRTASLGSFGSFDSNSVSLQSFNSGSLVDFISEPDISGNHPDKMASFPASTISGSSSNVDLFKSQLAPEPVYSEASNVDLFKGAATSTAPSLDLFQLTPTLAAPSTLQHQTPQAPPSASLDLFADFPQHQSDATLDSGEPELSKPKNEGWATFDSPNSTPSVLGTNSSTHDLISGDGDLWHGGLENSQGATTTSTTQPWNAFGESAEHLPSASVEQNIETKVVTHPPPSSVDHQYLGFEASQDLKDYGLPLATSITGPPGQSVQSNLALGTSCNPSVLSLMVETPAHGYATGYKSTNPFDIPYDSHQEQSNVFSDMSSLQAALPSSHLSSTILNGVHESWFLQNPGTPYVPAAPQGGLAFMGGQAPSSQIPNVPTQGPVASIGGNPFA
ncbi:hypothetical protein BT93_K1448 [Corymbia citriodora subsp. variegata]|nr:hypothetical protein BT93_K1448 [Corymbia citriodora subsp. variegata]